MLSGYEAPEPEAESMSLLDGTAYADGCRTLGHASPGSIPFEGLKLAARSQLLLEEVLLRG